MAMHVDEVLEGIYQRLCIRAQDSQNAADHSMSVAELRAALGVSEALLKEALWLLTFPGDKRISFPAAVSPDAGVAPFGRSGRRR
jgi:hypothetical protein